MFGSAHEELEIEFFSRYDYMQEAYGPTAKDADDYALGDMFGAEVEYLLKEGYTEEQALEMADAYVCGRPRVFDIGPPKHLKMPNGWMAEEGDSEIPF